MNRFVIGFLVLAAAFAAGYAPKQKQLLELERDSAQTASALESELLDTTQRLEIAVLHNDLGRILVEVEENNFGAAQELSTRFFDRLNTVLLRAEGEEADRALRAISNRRDEITADLTALNPQAAAKLRKLYKEFPTISSSGPQVTA